MASDRAEMVDGFQKSALESRLGRPPIYGIDAVHGNNSTHNIGLGATRCLACRDADLAERIGAATALEVRVCRDPRWGIFNESYSEDTEIVRKMSSIVSGLQGQSPQGHQHVYLFVAGRNKVIACDKHFVGDGGTARGKNEGNSALSYEELDREAKRILVAGSHADDLGYQCGGWTKNWQGSGGRITIGTTLLDVIQEAVGEETEIIYEQSPSKQTLERNDISFAIVAVGEATYAKSVGDNAELVIPFNGLDIIRSVADKFPTLVILLQAETTSRKEVTVSSSASHDSFPESETTRRNEGSNNKFLSVMEIMDEQDMGKHFLGLAIPMVVALVLSASSLVQTTEMKIVLTTLSFAVALICNGLLLRKIFTTMRTVMIILGSSLMMLSFFSLVALFLPLSLKWIPLLCWLGSLIPFALYGYRAYFRQVEQDPERGQ